jgi:hypothetical protein
MREVSLHGYVGTGLILVWPSGVHYSNQAGGYSCNQPSIEGVLIPIGNDVAVGGNEDGKLMGPDNVLCQYFVGAKHQGTGATSGLDQEDADHLDRLLGCFPDFEGVRSDRARLRDSMEAWVWVTIAPRKDAAFLPLFTGFGDGPWSAVLFWGNSD